MYSFIHSCIQPGLPAGGAAARAGCAQLAPSSAGVCRPHPVVLSFVAIGAWQRITESSLRYAQLAPPVVGLYKIIFYYEAFVHESNILVFPPPTCIGHTVAILLHDFGAVYEPPSDLPFACHTPYNIGNNNIV